MKDTNNLLTHNQWSAGEYENKNTIFDKSNKMKEALSNSYSNIGEQSIKITKQESGAYSRLFYLDNIINKTFTVSASIKSNKYYDTQFILAESYNTGKTIQAKAVTIPKNTTSKNVSVTLTTSSICEAVSIQININYAPEGTSCYIDNLNLTTQ